MRRSPDPQHFKMEGITFPPVNITSISPNRTALLEERGPLLRGRTAQCHKSVTAPRPGREFSTNLFRTSRRTAAAAGFWTWDGLASYQTWTLAWIWLPLLRCHFLPRKRTGQNLLPTFVHLFPLNSSSLLHHTQRQIDHSHRYYDTRFVRHNTKSYQFNKNIQSPRSG